MSKTRKPSNCTNSMVKGECDERVIRIYMWEEVEPGKPMKSIEPKEEQEISAICEHCDNYREKQ